MQHPICRLVTRVATVETECGDDFLVAKGHTFRFDSIPLRIYFPSREKRRKDARLPYVVRILSLPI